MQLWASGLHCGLVKLYHYHSLAIALCPPGPTFHGHDAKISFNPAFSMGSQQPHQLIVYAPSCYYRLGVSDLYTTQGVQPFLTLLPEDLITTMLRTKPQWAATHIRLGETSSTQYKNMGHLWMTIPFATPAADQDGHPQCNSVQMQQPTHHGCLHPNGHRGQRLDLDKQMHDFFEVNMLVDIYNDTAYHISTWAW